MSESATRVRNRPSLSAEGLNPNTGPTGHAVTERTNDPSADAETESVKASLRRLAGTDAAALVEQAETAVADLDAAVEFVETVGLADLERAVETVDDPVLRRRGEDALETFRRYRRAAFGDGIDPDHFHREYRTDLSRGDQGLSR